MRATLSSPLTISGTSDLEDDRVPLATARADRGATDAAAAAAQLVHQHADDPCARGSDRMPQRHCATVDVHLVLIDAEHANAVQGDRGERLVDLPEIHILR